MLGVGWTEMLVIGVVALIVIGPKELPAMMRRIGQFAGTVRRMGQDFQRELNKTTGLNEITNLRNSVTAPLKATADAIRKEFNASTATPAAAPLVASKPVEPAADSVVDELLAEVGLDSEPGVSLETVLDTAPTPVPAPMNSASAPATPSASPVAVHATPPFAQVAAPAVIPTPAAAAPASPVAPVASTPAAEAVVPAARPRAPRVKPVPAAASVKTADLPAATPVPKRTRKVAAIESPAPAEALPPAETASPKSARKAAVAAPEATAETKPKRTRSVANKSAAKTTDEG